MISNLMKKKMNKVCIKRPKSTILFYLIFIKECDIYELSNQCIFVYYDQDYFDNMQLVF